MRPKHLRPTILVGSILLTVTLLLSGCGGSSATTRQASENTGVGEPGVVHVHGLGINPKDGLLYAATHTGLFRITGYGTAERVGDRYQDTMGFTIVGPDHFLGSGHPDMRDLQAKRFPSLLGLIESTDAGKTWHTRSLSGKADFHALRAAHSRIYGFDSTGGAFMVSPDGTTWETRAQVLMRDFAVSPTDPDHIVAAMAQDVQQSRDGGRAWQPLEAPPLVLLAWQDPGALFGLTAAGVVFTSTDAGASWQQQGTLNGAPQALLATGDSLYAAVHEGGIHRSNDGGRSWRVYYREPA